MWYLLTAYSVITVFGASIPLGKLLTVCIAGLARQSLLSVQGGPPLPSLPLLPSGSLTELCQIISMCGRPARPGREVRMSVCGAIWLALIPYVASSCGVATYIEPVKLLLLWGGVLAWDSPAAENSSGTADRACRLAARLFSRLLRLASWALVSGIIMPGDGLRPAVTTGWLLDRLGPDGLSGLAVRSLPTRQITVARNTANVTAASA